MPAWRPELAVVDLVEGGVEVAEAGEDRDRAERLLAIEAARAVDILEQGRLEHRALALAAAEQLAPAATASWIQLSSRRASLR